MKHQCRRADSIEHIDDVDARARLQNATGRIFTAEEKAEIDRVQTKAYRWTFLLSGMTHPNFDKSLHELSAQGHERVSQLARAIA